MTMPRRQRHAPETILKGDQASDPAGLLAEIILLHGQLTEARLRAANLEAAILAALRAREDGGIEDPLDFLRDEIACINGDDAYGA